jgi:hypothetical protein
MSALQISGGKDQSVQLPDVCQKEVEVLRQLLWTCRGLMPLL